MSKQQQQKDAEMIAETIIWMARKRMRVEPYQNLNSAIHGVMMEINQPLMEFMAEQKYQESRGPGNSHADL